MLLFVGISACALAAEPSKQPPDFVKKATWEESLVSAREALFDWETAQENKTMAEVHLVAEPWYLLGPIPGKGKEFDAICAGKFDFNTTFTSSAGQPIGWQKRDDFVDAKMNEIGRADGAGADAVYILCRSVFVNDPTSKSEAGNAGAASESIVKKEKKKVTIAPYLELAAESGATACWLPAPGGKPAAIPLGNELPLLPVPVGTSLDVGEHRLMISIPAGAAGHRFFCRFMPTNIKQGFAWRHGPLALRVDLLKKAQAAFTAPADRFGMNAESADGIWFPNTDGMDWAPDTWGPQNEWIPGQSVTALVAMRQSAAARRLATLREWCNRTTGGIQAQAAEPFRDPLLKWCDAREAELKNTADPECIRKIYQTAAVMSDVFAADASLRSLRLAVNDLTTTFGTEYRPPQPPAEILDALEKEIAAARTAAFQGTLTGATLVGLEEKLEKEKYSLLLANPLLAFGKLLVARGGPAFSGNHGGANFAIGDELVTLSPVRPDGEVKVIYKGVIKDYDLHWDGKRILLSLPPVTKTDVPALWEINADGTGMRRVTREKPPVNHYDGAYLPDGRVICISDACKQAVPCTGAGGVGNIHILNADGSDDQRVTFDQDHDWNPTVLNDGRVVFTRWDYENRAHYWTYFLFTMNPDGSGQNAYFGPLSHTWWPNSLYWPRPIPGHPSEIITVISGHHGPGRVGELLLFDPARGNDSIDAAVQKIPGYGRKVEPVILDDLVGKVWPRFATPYPLGENGGGPAGGKYFLVSMQRRPELGWDLCLVDIFDNIVPILTGSGGYCKPFPLRSRPLPPVIPSVLHPGETEGTVYIADLYSGEGLKGYPRGSIKSLRIASHHYKYEGDNGKAGVDGAWDIKRILGTVPIGEDGSALFKVPANTPIFFQPLDAEGKAQQVMRSWTSLRPGEVASCVGCHDNQNKVPPNRLRTSGNREPVAITPWNGPVRGFSFPREVQPVLDHRCIGCHDGSGKIPDLRAKPRQKGENFSSSYMALQPFVRRVGLDGDKMMLKPAEFDADTSALVQLLKKGHHNVSLTADDWERLYTWIDLNVPHYANYRESYRPPEPGQVETRAEYLKLYANYIDHNEDPLPMPAPLAYEPPPAGTPRAADPPAPEGWPFDAKTAVEKQKQAGQPEQELDLGGGVRMPVRLVPSGKFVMGSSKGFDDEQPAAVASIGKPFYLGTFEVSNKQFARFDPDHNSGFSQIRDKDRVGYPPTFNEPDQPVVRVSWNEAMAFCAWLSKTTGRKCTLPTESEWEWACRAGTTGPWSLGEPDPKHPTANLAGEEIGGWWNFGRRERGWSDGAMWTVPGGKFPANAWGLFDMHGNAAEWTRSAYRPYPYKDDGRDDPTAAGPRVVRGGSWNDTLPFATSHARWRYEPYKPVYNVGFRVRVEP